ncbi:hypothetical protein SAMCCGM7_Ch0676 [Sinorhizobium americanum CCGM7]|nr:hypothetical protein SAMCCGM7_Ch0676 [Sinorhizobium americanum CCGM7]
MGGHTGLKRLPVTTIRHHATRFRSAREGHQTRRVRTKFAAISCQHLNRRGSPKATRERGESRVKSYT